MLGFSGPRNVNLDFRRPDGGHAGWTVIAGRNGAGKTSLLRCLAIALSGHPSTARALAPSFPLWRTPGDLAGVLSADLRLNAEETADLAGRLPEFAGLPSSYGHYSFTVGAPERGGRGSYAFDVAWEHGLSTTPLDQPDEPGTLLDNETARSLPTNWFAAGYGPFRRLSHDLPSPATGDSGIRSDPVGMTVDRFATLFHEDAALSEGVAWLVGLHLQSLEGKAGATRLMKTVLELLGNGLLPDNHKIVRVDSAGLWVRHRNRVFPLRQMSDGYKVVAALVLDIVRNLHLFYGGLKPRRSKQGIALHTPGVVLIDEIDAHLHVSWQQRIGEWLKRHFPKIQFIVTTHSPYICQAADPGGLIRLPGPSEDRAPEVVDEDTYRRIVYGTGDDAALSGLFGLDTPYSGEAEEARRKLVVLEEKVFSGTATKSENRRYQELSELLNSSLEARVDEVSGRLGRLP